MKRFKSLLSLIVAVVAVFMVGFTTVKADQIKLVSGKVFFGNTTNKDGKKRDFHLKKVSGNDSAYAFCLDSQHVFFEGNYTSNSGLNYNSAKIKNVILNAYSAGLGTGSNKYGISNDELYMITQMAVWDAAHGTYQYDVNNKYGHDGMAIGDTYDAWLSESGKEYRRRIYNELRETASIPNVSISVNANGKTNAGLTAAGDRSDFGSEQFKIDGPSYLTYTVSIDKNSSSKGACVWYGGECKESQQIPAGKNFRLKADYVANQDVKVVANVKSSEYLTGYSFNLYQPNGNGNNYQNAAVFIPEHNKYEAKISATGRDDVKREQPTTLKVSKKSGAGQEELAGAEMKIKDLAGNIVTDANNQKLEWISDGTTKEIEGLVPGKIYQMVETSTKEGFEPLTVNIYFRMDEEGKVELCNVKDNNESTADCSSKIEVKEDNVTYAEINGEVLIIRNYPSKPKESSVLISKKDFTNGKEIEGAKLKICTLEAYEKDGNSCTPSEKEWTWTSGKEAHKIALQPGEYVLFETLSVEGYEDYMLIGEDQKEKTTAYRFKIVEGEQTKIDVYNELKPKTVVIKDVPKTGVTTSAYLIGSLVMIAGAGTIVVAKKKENM